MQSGRCRIALAAPRRFRARRLRSDWADVEGRIQYAYYTNDARALNSVLDSLKPKPVEGEAEAAGDDARHARATSAR